MSSKFIELLPDHSPGLETHYHHHRPSAEDVRLEDVLAETEIYTRSRSNSSVTSSSPRESSAPVHSHLFAFGHARKGSRDEDKSPHASQTHLSVGIPKEPFRGHSHSKSTGSECVNQEKSEKDSGAFKRLRRFTLNAGSKA